MRKILTKLLLIASILLYAKSLQAQPDFEQVRQNISERLAADEFQGIAIAYIHPDGRTRFINHGSLDTTQSQPVDKNTIFEIGSVSKTFTALLAAKMAEDGVISLDDPIKMLLPDSVSIPSYKGQEITIRHLATHTSGLPRIPSNLNPKDPLNPYADYTITQLFQFLSSYSLWEVPGTAFAYSNLGMGLLGYLLERQSGKSYEQLLQKYITGPLKMDDTGIFVPEKKHNRFAAPYNYGAPAKYWNFPALAGAGAIRSTTADLARYMKAQLRLTHTHLTSAIIKTHEIQTGAGSGLTDAVGLGWFFTTSSDTIIWHNGGTGGFHSFTGFNKKDETAAVVLANGKDPIDDIGLHLLDEHHKLKKVRKMIKVDKTTLTSYTGTYVHSSGIKYAVSRKGNELMVQISGQATQRIFPKSQTRFYYKVAPAEIEFTKNENGEVTGLTLYQNGMEIQAKKVKPQ